MADLGVQTEHPAQSFTSTNVNESMSRQRQEMVELRAVAQIWDLMGSCNTTGGLPVDLVNDHP